MNNENLATNLNNSLVGDKRPSIYFELTQHVFAAHYHQQIILLDIVKNEYLSLGDKAYKYFLTILENQFQRKENFFILVSFNEITLHEKTDIDTPTLNSFIQIFLEKKLITISGHEKRKNHFATAFMPIGLSQIEWKATRKKILGRTTIYNTLKIIFALFLIHYTIRNKGIHGLLALLTKKAAKAKRVFKKINMAEVNKISFALDKTCILYPAKTSCLPWAGTLAYLLISRGWSCDLVIGIQTAPFYAHAWIEINKKVINDKLEVQERLAPILRLSF